MKKYLHWLVVFIFLLFSFWQMNDPDPIRWIAIYLGVVISVILFINNKYVPFIPLAGAILSLAGALYLLPDFFYWIKLGMPTITGQMKAESPHIELMREFLGFVISGLTYFFYYRAHRKAKISTAS